MKLPHLEPLIFAKKIIEKKQDSSIVLCEFRTTPTLTTFIEAAAQSSASFVDQSIPQLGFLATVKNIEKHKEFDTLEYHIHLKLEVEVGEFKQFSFEVFNLLDKSKSYAAGSLSVALKKIER